MSQDSFKFPDTGLLHAAINIASGMEEVHARNIVHGDLRPANVLVRPADGSCIQLTENNFDDHINGVYKIAHFDHAFDIDDVTKNTMANVGTLP